MLDKKNFYINGKWVSPIEPRNYQVIDPSNEEVCAEISLGGKKDVDQAVIAAKKAFQTWAFTKKEERLELLEKLYAIYKKRWAEMAKLISLEMGAPIKFSTEMQAATGASHIKSFKRILKEFNFEKDLGEEKNNQKLLYEPSEVAPLSSMLLAEMIDEAKFPDGVFNLVNGDGAVTGDALTSHPNIDMISFTGSTRAGALISQNAAKDFKRISLELGGKGANIIFKDADSEAVARGVLRCFRNSGQSCNAPTRMLVEKSIYNETIEKVKELANNTKVDSPQKDGDHIGPVVSEIQFNKIQTLIQKGIDEGAKLVAGGTGKPQGLEKGYYVKPTVFADVNNQMEIARTEIFGPVLSIIPFESEEEAISIANDTPYGLTNYIQTQDKEKVKRVAKKLRSGMVDVNGVGIAGDSPFGGYKHSGIGREAGIEGLTEFLEVKTVGGWS